jgi:hypothetical protein
MAMTPGERNELKLLVNERARLEMTRLKSLAADRLVELNDQLEAQWREEDFQIRELMAQLRRDAEEANARVQARCDELGILPELRPEIYAGMIRPPTTSGRRSQLRQIAQDQNKAALAQAQHAVDTWKLETRTALVREGLTSEAAQQFLQSMPGADQLLPMVSVDQLLAELDTQSKQREKRLRELGY